ASVCRRIAHAALLISVLLSQWLAVLPAHAEIGPVTESESRRCGLSAYSAPMDCSSYEAVFATVDAFCKQWQNMEAYLAYSDSGANNGGLLQYDYYKINCRNTRNPPGQNSGWEGGYLGIERTAQCPSGSGWKLSIPARVCERPDIPQSCRIDEAGASTPHPILPATAEKYRHELDWRDSGPAPLSLSRTYRSVWAGDPRRPDTGLGEVWTHNHSARLRAIPAGAPHTVAITLPDGQLRTFMKAPGAALWTTGDSADTLASLASGAWTYRRAEDDAVFQFDAGGKLQSRTDRNGWATSYSYDASKRLASVTNAFGRTLAFAYNGAGQLATVTTPDGRVIGYTFDAAGRLSSVAYPDGKSRSFAYENAAYPQALSGISDENGMRWGSFAYDGQGRAVGTELAGGVDRYQVNYLSPSTAAIVDPLGTSRSYGYGSKAGKLAVTSGSLPAGEGESDAASRTQDANGLITS
ncbi:DUF6531 domain-containing protein, partial [Variovorax sp. KK3]|uniref:DUF6531 domain-containing protein n=4 Tax=Variovorax sp. KK3 TaxID=1855728 RepID=UPI0011805166